MPESSGIIGALPLNGNIAARFAHADRSGITGIGGELHSTGDRSAGEERLWSRRRRGRKVSMEGVRMVSERSMEHRRL